MAKTKNGKNSFPRTPLVNDATKHSIIALACFVLALFFIAAQFHYAGGAGETIYQVLAWLLGSGFFVLPLLSVVLGLSFLKPVRPHFVGRRFLAGLVCLLAVLGLLSALSPGPVAKINGGWLGQIIASPLQQLFDLYSLIILFTLVIISLLVIFDVPLQSLIAWRPKKIMAGATPEIYTGAEPPPPSSAGQAIKQAPIKQTAEVDAETFSIPTNGLKLKSDLAFTPPPLSLLERDSGQPGAGDIKGNANIIKRTLQNFGILVEVDEITIGPSITRYAIKPAEGVKLSRIVGLQNDLSLALAAHPLRIEAPIPGRSLVGIEIPNQTKSLVGLASLVGSQEFSQSPLPLLVSLGRGISGVAHFANLSKAPHILIAGATGSGKSVVIHTFITSLLYRNSPERLRFIMIDPKRVELTLYNKIPHLLTPVVTDAKKAILVLKWAIKEMERRYGLLETYSVRDIASYHQNILPASEENETLPYIVIVIDELADIMSAYPRELEAVIVRLAQMSRAVGIHLMVSTQRPSVEVITGLIKANIPSRVALQVASQIDSRTILDMAGAEKLLGAGDMLYISAEMSKPIRLQSAFISENEVKKVTAHLAKHTDTSLADGISLTGANANNLTSDDLATVVLAEADDEMYEQAREEVMRAGKASASYLQRKLKIGYARAARLLDMLEERKVIGPGEGAKIREVYDKYPPADGNF